MMAQELSPLQRFLSSASTEMIDEIVKYVPFPAAFTVLNGSAHAAASNA